MTTREETREEYCMRKGLPMDGRGPRLYNAPPASIEHMYEQRGDGCWYAKEFDREFTPDERSDIEAYEGKTIWNGPGVPTGEPEEEPKMNPKYVQAQKDGKIRMECLATSVLASEARVLAHGADKYGARNWRKDEILASTYEGAMMRHLFAWINGEDLDPDSGEPHLSHLRACAAVVMDADSFGKLVDDRNRMESKNE